MRSLLFGLAFLAGCADVDGVDEDTAVDGKADGVSTRKIISRSSQSADESESWLARSNNTLLAAWIGEQQKNDWPGVNVDGTGEGTIGYALSFDGGKSWAPPAALAYPMANMPVNVKVVAASDGGFFATWIGRGADADLGDAIIVAHANARGVFDAPVEVTRKREPGSPAWYDLPMVASQRGVAMVAYAAVIDQSQACMRTEVARSSDGAHWTRTFVGECTEIHNMHALCAAEGGKRAYLAMVVGDAQQMHIELHASDDGGATWSALGPVTRPTDRIGFDPITCAAKGDDLWIAYGTTKDPFLPATFNKLSTVDVVHFADGREVARYDARSGAPFAMHPQIAIDPNGLVYVAYRAGSRDDDPNGTLRWTRLGAKGFSPSREIDGPIKLDQNWGVAPFLGDYFGLVATETALLSAHAIVSRGTRRIAFRRI